MPDGDILVVSGDFTENSSKAEVDRAAAALR